VESFIVLFVNNLIDHSHANSGKI